MTALQNPDSIRHFQSLCDACQDLASRYHSPSELRLYADGYLHALRRTAILDVMDQRLEMRDSRRRDAGLAAQFGNDPDLGIDLLT